MDFTQTAANAFSSSRPASSAAKYLDKILTWGIRLLTFLIPIAFLPWTFEIFEFNKQLILLVIGSLLLVVWLAKIVITREVKILKSPLNLAVLAYFVVYLLATIFSIDPITSILGFYGRFNGGLISLLGYVILYYLVMQTVSEQNNKVWLLISWLSGVGLGSLVLFLQMLGLRWLGFPAADLATFSPLGGSLNATALLLAATLPLGLYLAKVGQNSVIRIGSLVVSVLSLIILFMVDYQLGWIGLVVSTVSWLLFVFWKNEAVSFHWTMIPALALLLAAVSWPLATPALTRLQIPVEVNLSLSSSWKIAWQDVVSRPVLGSGPETFIYGFSKYKPDNFNDSNFWAFRFDKASSEYAQLLATTGFVGILGYIVLILIAAWLGYKLLKDKSRENWYFGAALVSAFLVLVIGNGFYFSNTVLSVNLWLILALLASITSKSERNVSLTGSPRASFMFSFGLAVVVLAAAGIIFASIRFWQADVAYAQAQTNSQAVETLDAARDNLVSAVTLNPWRDTYRIGLAQVFLALANKEANEPAGKSDEDKQAQLQRLQSYIASSIAAARSATELSKENVANWEALGSIYRGTVLFAKDAENWVIDSFENAVKLEPSNPALYTELGKAYLISANRNRQEAAQAKDEDKKKLEDDANTSITKAMEEFDKAVKLKSNYTPAHFNEVLALELQGKIDDAINKLQSMREYNPQDIDVIYEQASLYYTKAEYKKAEEAFSLIISLVPNHANAQYGLALTYIKEGEKDKAITQLQKVIDMNPGNDALIKQMDELKNPTPEKKEGAGTTVPPVTPPTEAPKQ